MNRQAAILEKNIETFTKPKENTQSHNLTFVAAGDNLFHDVIIRNHRQEDGTYDFTPIYSEIKSLIDSADLAFINQETVMAGTEFGYSGYPLFNTPQSLGQTLADTGFGIVNLANNHAMDMGETGLLATLEFFDTIPQITVIGAQKTGESHKIIEKNNITLGFLAYAHSLNGISLPDNNPNLVSVINRNKMSTEINTLRPLCDFLIVSMHWGAEYLKEPDAEQTALAVFLAEHNVDLVIGHHPHVLQRVDRLPRPDGKETLCFYSLGNFVSSQREKARLLGGLMLITFTKENGNLYISNSGLIPVVTHYEMFFENTVIYPLFNYNEELLGKHLMRTWDSEMDFGYFNSVISNLGIKLIMHNIFAY